ncbi:hypothetical protein B0H14DRAFT_2651584 [Mycena olivaceomarginata]|nr:hypothetical protein B0H14DRAFT_2651584 [Mycena olivaceomarginata]
MWGLGDNFLATTGEVCGEQSDPCSINTALLSVESTRADRFRAEEVSSQINLLLFAAYETTSRHCRDAPDPMQSLRGVLGLRREGFQPARWLDESPGFNQLRAQEIQGYRHLLTFSDGARICLGKVFAVAEFKAVLSFSCAILLLSCLKARPLRLDTIETCCRGQRLRAKLDMTCP